MDAQKWYVAERYSGNVVSIRAEGAGLVADCYLEGPDESVAKLIASAPSLLAERDELRKSIEHKDRCYDECQAERDELRAVLREIVNVYAETYSLDCNLGGISQELITRAERLVGEKS